MQQGRLQLREEDRNRRGERQKRKKRMAQRGSLADLFLRSCDQLSGGSRDYGQSYINQAHTSEIQERGKKINRLARGPPWDICDSR